MVIVNFDGKKVKTTPATNEELEKIKSNGFLRCDEGVQACIGDKIYVCVRDGGRTYWASTGMYCNENLTETE